MGPCEVGDPVAVGCVVGPCVVGVVVCGPSGVCVCGPDPGGDMANGLMILCIRLS